MMKQARLKNNSSAVNEFFQNHAELIEKYLAFRYAPDHQRIPIRRLIAQRARDMFGYSQYTCDSDIVYRIIKCYQKS